MLVYGDFERTQDPREKLARLASALTRLPAVPAHIERHGALVAAFIEASELAQGLADAAFEARGEDAPSGLQEAATALLMAIAGAVVRSWRTDFADGVPSVSEEMQRLRALAMPERIRSKRAEGYAHYALYPESCAEAALKVEGGGPFVVIGIRSIGLGLAAMVSASLGAPPPISVRPMGDPFRRKIVASPELTARVVADRHARFLIVDEGPGLSGSSFGAVADWLEANGVPSDRIVFFPSHGGDLGPQAGQMHRERWSAARRHVVEFDDLVIRAPTEAHRLEGWVADLCGSPVNPLDDLSGGNWRGRMYPSEADWPAANVRQERRKYRLRSRSGSWLLKFAGLGADAVEKVERARALHEAGFTPQPLGCRHGFLVERWLEGAQPLHRGPIEHAKPVERIARYLAFRARTFPAPPEAGASLHALLAMARRNTELGLGSDTAAALDRWTRENARLEAHVFRVNTDSRMQVWEWLVTQHGELVKTDALDHSSAHDLVGCQDIAWDVAGAAVEFELDDAEQSELRDRVAQESRQRVDPDLVAFYRVSYLAFQMGSQHLAARALVGWPAEAERLTRSEARYRHLLATELSMC